ncbi:MAG: nucleoid-associated protein [Bacteroidota bacterium]
MIAINDAKIQQLIIHSLRSKSIQLSEQQVTVDQELAGVLKFYFLDKFRNQGQFYHFVHQHDLAMNEVFSFAEMIFSGQYAFEEVSQAIANFLFSKSGSANIKEGELYVVALSGLLYGDESLDGIGIFKSENKDTFLKVFPGSGGLAIEKQEGINIRKLDKGAVILNTKKSDGYRILVVDQTNKREQAKYWMEDFLHLQPVADNYHRTDQFMEVFKSINQQAPEEIDKVEQIDLVSSSVAFFEENETFESDKFYEDVLYDERRQRLFEKVYAEQTGTLPKEDEGFEVSQPALRKSKKFIRSVIKLDKSFHVYVHANRDRIERGFDDSKQLNFYKLYFQDES